MMAVYYFAYGSNMDPERMKKRIGYLPPRQKALLKGWKLVFNKVATRNPREGYANITKDEKETVEGILYEIEEQDLKKLDNYEGHPYHYDRKEMEVELEDGTKVKAWVYVANPNMVKEGLKPSREYLSHLLKGCDLLSEEYCEKLRSVKTLED